jgi:hypothetical protein
MGLRFRKSISIIPGVKLNFGKSGMSVSTGVPGFRKTFHSSGRVTTSVGIPGTGISYVTTENKNRTPRNQRQTRNETPPYYEPVSEPIATPDYNEPKVQYDTSYDEPISKPVTKTVTTDIHKITDDVIDWTEVMVSPTPPDDSYDAELWTYFHNVAAKVLSGDIDTYLQVINDINPLNDLLDYGTGFEFGTDSSLKMEVEFQINSDNVDMPHNSTEYQDYVCSVAIRVARDIFALLPVQNVLVHATNNGNDILSVRFDKKTFSELKFNFIDPSETINKFEYNMRFGADGFDIINRIE